MLSAASSVKLIRLARLKFSPLFLALCALLLPATARAQTFSSSTSISIPNGTGSTPASPYPASGTCTSNGACVAVSGLTGSYTSMSITLSYSILNNQSFSSPAILLESPTGQYLDILSFGCAQSTGTTATFTLSDGAASLFPPAFNGTTPVECTPSGNYQPAAYEVSTDSFPSPGPGVSGYTVAGDGSNPCAGNPVYSPCTSGTGTIANTFCPLPTSCVSSLNGTWKLFAADQGGLAAQTVFTWSLTFNVTGSNDATTTTLSKGSPNPAFTSAPGSTVTFTAAVEDSTESAPATTGTVTLFDNATGLSYGPAAVNSSGQATFSVTFTTEGAHDLDAVYNGGTGLAGSTSGHVSQSAVNHATKSTNGSVTSFCNPGPITVLSGAAGNPYPSKIVLGNTGITTEPTLSGPIESVSVSLNNVSLSSGEELDDLGLLLQAPGSTTTPFTSSGNAFEFLSWAGNPFTSGSLTISDTGTATIPYFSAPPCTNCLPTDNYIDIGTDNSDSFPAPAPSSFVTAAPTGTGTFTTEFGGGGVSGTWSLYLDNRLSEGGTLGNLGSWCLNFTVPEPAALISPTSGSTLTGPSVTFSWSAGIGASAYQLWLGSTGVNSNNVYSSGVVTATSVTPLNLPLNGETVYARLYTELNGTWVHQDYTFTAAAPAVLTAPTPGGLLTGPVTTFTWSAPAGESAYQLWLGTTGVASNNLVSTGVTHSNSSTPTKMPTNGETVYARIYTDYGGTWVHKDYTYTAVTQSAPVSPAAGATLAGPTQTFTWTAAPGSGAYEFWLGTTGVASNNLYSSGVDHSTSTTRTNLPTNGETIYARLFTDFNGTWVHQDYTLTAAQQSAPVSPAVGATLAGPSQTFTWTAGTGSSIGAYEFWLGSTGVASNDVYSSGVIHTTSVARTNLPTNGETLYARLYTDYNGTWVHQDYTLTAAAASMLTSPSSGGELSGASETFNWSTATGAVTQYQFWLGTTGVASNNLYSSGATTATSVTVDNLPTDGQTIYARLYTNYNGVWVHTDYTYVAAK